MKKINYKAIIIVGALVLLGIILNALTNIFVIANQIADSGRQLNSLDGWIILIEVIFTGVLFIFVMLDWQSANTIKALLIGFTPILIVLAVLGANVIEAASLIVCLSVVYFKTQAFDNHYIQLSLGLVTVGLTGSFLVSNLQGYVIKNISIMPNISIEVYSIWDILMYVGLIGIIVIGQLELIKYIVSKRHLLRIR